MSNLTNNRRNKRLQKFSASFQALTKVNVIRSFQNNVNELTTVVNEKVDFVINELMIKETVPTSDPKLINFWCSES